MRRLNVAVLFFFLSGSAFGQTLTITQFLKSSLNDVYFKSFDAQSTFLQSRKSFSLPLIDQLQFRYQDNQFNNFQSRYGLRVDPVNPWHAYRNNQYYQGVQTLKVLEQKMVLKKLLLNRYGQIVQYWMATEASDIVYQQRLIREKISKAYAAKAGSSGFNPDKYIETQLDLLNKEADWQEAELKKEIARQEILNATNSTALQFDFSELISIDRINQLISSSANEAEQTEYQLLIQRLAVAGKKLNAEKSDFNLGFLQAMYNSDRRLGDTNTMGLAFGISIPLPGSNKENVTREKLNQLERQSDVEKFKSENSAEKKNDFLFLKIHLMHYQKVDSLINTITERKLNTFSALANNYDPILELSYEEKLIQFDVLKSKIKKEILLQYIAYLDTLDKLHERPLVNYLSKNLEAIEQ